MKINDIYNAVSELPEAPTVAAIGNFDGVHPGHRAVFRKANEEAAARGIRMIAVTFSGNPKFFSAGKGHILPERQQEEALYDAGVRTLLRLHFEEYRDRTPEQFVRETLIGALDCRCVLVGEDFRFGKDRAGDTALLGKLLRNAGRELIVVPTVCFEGKPLSSTSVREAIAAGEPERAAAMLGRPLCYALPVIGGAKLGRTLGFPTANQRFPEQVQLPRFGVYASEAETEDGKKYAAVSDVGVKPTVGSEYPLMETHLLGFSGELCGQTLRVTLKHFLRDEKKFESTDALREQIAKDTEQAIGLQTEK